MRGKKIGMAMCVKHVIPFLFGSFFWGGGGGGGGGFLS